MRAAIFGAAMDDVELMLRFVRASSCLTHSDPKATCGAIAVALAARHARMNERIDAEAWLSEVDESIGEEGVKLSQLLRQAVASCRAEESSAQFAESLGLGDGVTGYTNHTVPVAIHAWLSHPRDYRAAITSVIRCGGDADTTAAIVGGIVGAGVGREGIPDQWMDGLTDWPRSVEWIEKLGDQLTHRLPSGTPAKSPRVGPIKIIIRNIFFLLVVLFHGFRRLAPPY